MSTKNNLRIPPQDIDEEKSVLGSILLDKNAMINIVDFLRPIDKPWRNIDTIIGNNIDTSYQLQCT